MRPASGLRVAARRARAGRRRPPTVTGPRARSTRSDPCRRAGAATRRRAARTAPSRFRRAGRPRAARSSTRRDVLREVLGLEALMLRLELDHVADRDGADDRAVIDDRDVADP